MLLRIKLAKNKASKLDKFRGFYYQGKQKRTIPYPLSQRLILNELTLLKFKTYLALFTIWPKMIDKVNYCLSQHTACHPVHPHHHIACKGKISSNSINDYPQDFKKQIITHHL